MQPAGKPQLTRPDVVVMDLRMPGPNGVDATRRSSVAPATAVLVLTMFEDDESVFAAMRAGASGYLVKGAQQDEISGRSAPSPPVRPSSAPPWRGGSSTSSPGPGTRLGSRSFPDLTGREREVLNLIAAGRSNAAIARDLVISPKTVSNHISAIFAKLQVADRAEAIIRARQAGLGEPT